MIKTVLFYGFHPHLSDERVVYSSEECSGFPASSSVVPWFCDVIEKRRMGTWVWLQLLQFLSPLDSDRFWGEGR
jgi:hypothetical protein